MRIDHESPRKYRRSQVAAVVVALSGAALLVPGIGTAFATPVAAHRLATAIPTPPKDPAVAALVPASIRAKGSVSSAMDATYPPDELVAANGTTIVGMDADFSAALGAVMGVKWVDVNVTFDAIIVVCNRPSTTSATRRSR